MPISTRDSNIRPVFPTTVTGPPSCQDELIRQILLGFYLHLNINK